MIFSAVLSVVASSSSNDPPIWLLAAGPASATAVYWGLWRFYRNTDKSHSFESETLIVAQPVTGDDTKVGENNGTRMSSIQGKNSDKHRERVRRGF